MVVRKIYDTIAYPNPNHHRQTKRSKKKLPPAAIGCTRRRVKRYGRLTAIRFSFLHLPQEGRFRWFLYLSCLFSDRPLASVASVTDAGFLSSSRACPSECPRQSKKSFTALSADCTRPEYGTNADSHRTDSIIDKLLTIIFAMKAAAGV